MKIRLGQIVDEPLEWQEAIEVNAGEVSQPDLTSLSSVQCRGKVSLMPSGYLLELRLSYNQELTCNRCLTRIEQPVANDASFLLEVCDSPEMAEEVELQEEDFGVLRLQKSEFESRPLVLEQVLLGLPTKPLCREDCPGLCDGCGADLNAGVCDCKPEVDSRWAALQSLKK